VIELRDATAADWEEYFESPPPGTFRGVVGKLDGKIVGIGGVVYENGNPRAFMDLTAEGAKHPRDIIRATRMMEKKMEAKHHIVFAIASDDERAPGFLKHFGFEYLGSTKNGATYQWLNGR